MQRWALLVLLLKLIAIVAIWVGTGLWFKTAPPPSISESERVLNQVLTLFTAGSFSAVVALLDRSNVWRALRTAAFVCAGASLGGGLTSWDLTQGGSVTSILGALIGFALSRWKFGKAKE